MDRRTPAAGRCGLRSVTTCPPGFRSGPSREKRTGIPHWPPALSRPVWTASRSLDPAPYPAQICCMPTLQITVGAFSLFVASAHCHITSANTTKDILYRRPARAKGRHLHKHANSLRLSTPEAAPVIASAAITTSAAAATARPPPPPPRNLVLFPVQMARLWAAFGRH